MGWAKLTDGRRVWVCGRSVLRADGGANISMKHTHINLGGLTMPGTDNDDEHESYSSDLAQAQQATLPPENDDGRQASTAIGETDDERRARVGLSSVRATDELSKLVQKTPHRVSLDSILAKIEHEDYIQPERHRHMTICLITLRNGYIVLGKSVPADPANFDAALGMQFAKEDAIRQIWQLEAYRLREELSQGSTHVST